MRISVTWTAAVAAIGLAAASIPALAATYTVGAGRNFATPAQINWSVIRPGDTVTIYPGTYTAAGGGNSLQVANVAGTASQRITVNASSTTSRPLLVDGINVTQSSYVTISGLEVTRNPTSQPYAAVVVQNGSADVVLSNLKVRDAYVGVGFFQAGVRNRVEKSEVFGSRNHGITARGTATTANESNRSVVSGNNVHDNGGHGMEIESSYWRIESNVVTRNGTAFGGTSGIHFHTAVDSSTPDCDNNEIFYNYVSDQQDSTGPDGNGIQADSWCDGNKIAFNVVWNNAGTGVSLYVNRNNVVVGNTSYRNATDRGRLRWAGILRAEILLASVAGYCSSTDANGNCLNYVAIAAGRASGNIVYDNIVYSGQSDVQGIHANPEYVDPARNTNYLYPNLYYNAAGGANLRWGNSYHYSGTEIDAVSGLNAYGGGNLTELPVFVNPATPAKGSDGLALRTRPSRPGWVIQPATPDIKGVLPTSGVSYFGAYYTP